MSFGHSRIVDYHYPRRFAYVAELRKMGGEVITEEGQVMVEGHIELKGSNVRNTGWGALLVAALVAEEGRRSAIHERFSAGTIIC